MTKKTKIIVADDHAIVRKGIVQIIKEGLNFPVIEEVSDAEELFAAALNNNYDIVILDVSLPGRSGLEILEDIKKVKPQLPVLMLSINPVEIYGIRALKKGASGYLMKDAAPLELITAIRQILQGKKYVSAILGQALIEHLHDNPDAKPHDGLSDRELEVFRLLAKGMGLKEIAEKLSVGVTTISTYRARILEKMNFRNNADIIHYAIDKGLM